MATAAAVEGDEEYLAVVKTFIAERLYQQNLILPGYEIINEQREKVLNVAATLRRVGDELEASNAPFFNTMFTSIQITPNTMYCTFKGISDEIFVSGKNWGRIVAFLTFGSNLAIHCARRADLGVVFVDRVVKWISKYMSSQLASWMKQHGDWDGLINFFDKPNGGESSPSSFIVSALAGLGVGAIIMMTFK